MPVRSLIYFTDPHIGDVPPVGRTASYTEDMINKLADIMLLCTERHTTAVICGGDLFDQKRPNRVSHRLRTRLSAVLKSFPCPVYMVPGNHDMGPNELASLPNQPLGGLEESGAVKMLEHTELIWSGPTNNSHELMCVLIPRPYSIVGDADPLYYALTDQEKKDLEGAGETPVIMVAHGSIIPPGHIRPYPHVTADQIDLCGIDVLLAGHIHEELGTHIVEHNGRDVYFSNPGSLSRRARTNANYLREVGVIEIRINTEKQGDIALEKLKIPMRPFDEVFVGEAAETDDTPNDEIRKLADVLSGGLEAEELTLDEILAETGASKPVQHILREYLEEAGL